LFKSGQIICLAKFFHLFAKAFCAFAEFFQLVLGLLSVQDNAAASCVICHFGNFLPKSRLAGGRKKGQDRERGDLEEGSGFQVSGYIKDNKGGISFGNSLFLFNKGFFVQKISFTGMAPSLIFFS
jgi:hypothetical protein